MLKNNKIKIFLFFIIFLLFTGWGIVIRADDTTGLNIEGQTIGERTGLGEKDPRLVVANIVKIALGFLGIVAVSLIVYAGFVWMTAQGDKENIEKAKKIILGAIIGLIIILSAFGITSFVINKVIDVTGGNTDFNKKGGGGGERSFRGGGSSSGGGGFTLPFYITNSDPEAGEEGVFRNTIISVRFNRSLATSTSVNDLISNIKIEKVADIIYNPGTGSSSLIEISPVNIEGSVSVVASGYAIIFKASSSCISGSRTIDNCLPAWSKINVKINTASNLRSSTGQILRCDLARPCEFSFMTSDAFDVAKPVIKSISPLGGFCRKGVEPTNESCVNDSDCVNIGGICDRYIPNGRAGNLVSIFGKNFGTTGKVYFSSGSEWIEAKLAGDQTVGNVNCRNSWNDTAIIVVVPSGIADFKESVIKVENSKGFDLSNDIYGPILKKFLFNNISRPGICLINPNNGATNDIISYQGIAMSGARAYFGNIFNYSTSSDIFSQDKVGSGKVPNIFAGTTTTFVLKDKKWSNYLEFRKEGDNYKGPIINSFEPLKGRSGQYVSILGSGFGKMRATSKVFFGVKEADYEFPQICAQTVWTDSKIIVKVPNNIEDGQYVIRVVVSENEAVSTGLDPSKFTVDSNLKLAPSLCRVDPLSGNSGNRVSFWGEYFGDRSSGKIIFHANKEAIIESWGAENISSSIIPDKAVATVPNGAITGPVKIIQSDLSSNAFNFKIGSCSNDAECGSGACCPPGSVEAGKCKNDRNACFSKFNSCVYEFDFTTGRGGLTPEECSKTPDKCCVDAQNGNKVIEGRPGSKSLIKTDDGTEKDYAYCIYYQCKSERDSCNIDSPIASSSNIVYDSISKCSFFCQSTTGLGKECRSHNVINTSVCDSTICSQFSCLNEDGSGPTPPTRCGICCCNPFASPDQCSVLNMPKSNERLSCQPNKNPCSGEKRGLCCGCSSDFSCGGGDIVGCAIDACCRSRPFVATTSPTDGTTNVCRNALITAEFSEKMDTASFNGNIILIGDYGSSECPKETEYFSLKRNNIKNNLVKGFEKFLNKIKLFALKVLGNETYANDGNFCKIPGIINTTENASGKTELKFSPINFLDGNRDYYMIIKGEASTTDIQKEGVLSFYKVGMKGPDNKIFNGVEFKNAKIWKFTTRSGQKANGICAVDKILINPSSYLFTTTKNNSIDDEISSNSFDFDNNDSDKVFYASVLSFDNQELSPTIDYSWNWSWHPTNPSVVESIDIVGLTENKKFFRTKINKTEGYDIITATANINSRITELPSGPKSNSAKVYLMVCENPWPAIKSNGTWDPWRDTQGFNQEVYYCRDFGKKGTVDDLPAINTGTQSSASSSVDILKEYYFFRENIPTSTVIISTSSVSQGNAISLEWRNVSGANRYKVYYGLNSKNYSYSTSTLDNNITINNLSNNTKYYFAVTVLNSQGVESPYSNEVIIIPNDTSIPNAPAITGIIEGSRKVEIGWKDNSNGEIVYFKLFYGVKGNKSCDSTFGFGASLNIPYASNATTTVSGLSSGVEYCFGLIGYDNNKNASATTTAIARIR